MKKISTIITLFAAVTLSACAASPTPKAESIQPAQGPTNATLTTNTHGSNTSQINTPTATVQGHPIDHFLNPVYFDFDSAILTTAGKEQVLALAAHLQRHDTRVRLRIEGHADERGTVEYNLALGEKRARSTRDLLLRAGITPERLSIISYGEEKPAVHGSGEHVWNLNRRAEFVHVP